MQKVPRQQQLCHDLKQLRKKYNLIVNELYTIRQITRAREEALLTFLFKLLSPSERICLLYLAADQECKEVAQRMDCDVETIYKYVYRIKRKLKIHDLSEIASLIADTITSIQQAWD
jgi:DNA-binding CsgD family transcriptional regulator